MRGPRMHTFVSPVLCRLSRTRQLPTWCMKLRSCGTDNLQQELPPRIARKKLGRNPDSQRPASLQSGFEASVGVEEGQCSQSFLLLRTELLLQFYTSPRYEAEEFTRCEFFERRRANFCACGRVHTGLVLHVRQQMRESRKHKMQLCRI